MDHDMAEEDAIQDLRPAPLVQPSEWRTNPLKRSAPVDHPTPLPTFAMDHQTEGPVASGSQQNQPSDRYSHIRLPDRLRVLTQLEARSLDRAVDLNAPPMKRGRGETLDAEVPEVSHEVALVEDEDTSDDEDARQAVVALLEDSRLDENEVCTPIY